MDKDSSLKAKTSPLVKIAIIFNIILILISFIMFASMVLLPVGVVFFMVGASSIILISSLNMKRNSVKNRMKRADTMEYYRESVLDYGVFNLIGLVDELGLPIEERSVFSGVIMYFLYNGVLEDLGAEYAVKKMPTDEQGVKFIRAILPSKKDTKCNIKNRIIENEDEVLSSIKSSLIKDRYLDYPEKIKRNIHKMLSKHPEVTEEELTSTWLFNYDITDKGYEALEKVQASYNFFRDFTVMDERSKVEIDLWQDYLVMATIYNMADKVEVDLEEIMPELDSFKMAY